MRFHGDLGEPADRADAGVVDPDIDLAEALHGSLGHGPHGRCAGHVAFTELRLPAFAFAEGRNRGKRLRVTGR